MTTFHFLESIILTRKKPILLFQNTSWSSLNVLYAFKGLTGYGVILITLMNIQNYLLSDLYSDILCGCNVNIHK